MEWTLPFIGLFVGWLTNVLAIEMLFKPKKAMKIGRFRVPFTPGLIPLNRDKMINRASIQTTEVLLNSLDQEDIENSEQFKLFNNMLDNFWFTQMFVSKYKRMDLFKRAIIILTENSEIKTSVNKILKEQMKKYNVNELETTVRNIANDSLRGIKYVGAITGALVGLLSMLIGG